MSNEVLAVDCDDVLANTAFRTIGYYNRTYDTNVSPEHFYDTANEAWGADHDTVCDRVNQYLLTQDFANSPPIRGAVRALGVLAEGYEIHLVTGRRDFLRPMTEEMVERYFGGIFKSIIFTNFFTEDAIKKSDVCNQIGATCIIDDHLHHATEVAESGRRALLFGEYPWNRTDATALHPNVSRVKNWRTVLDVLMPEYNPGIIR